MATKLFLSMGLVVIVLAACGRRGDESGFTGDPTNVTDRGEGGVSPDGSAPSFGGTGGNPDAGCVNLQCQQVTCAAGTDTIVRGVVHAPTKIGADPLYDAIAYVPNAKPSPFPSGVSCDQCGALA